MLATQILSINSFTSCNPGHQGSALYNVYAAARASDTCVCSKTDSKTACVVPLSDNQVKVLQPNSTIPCCCS